MSDEERWYYIAEYGIISPSVTKARLRETPQNYRVLETIHVYGNPSYQVREGKLIRKAAYRNSIFDWPDEALEYIEKRLTRIIRRARSSLATYVRQREDLQHAIGKYRQTYTVYREEEDDGRRDES
jgi:hypothetical protein